MNLTASDVRLVQLARAVLGPEPGPGKLATLLARPRVLPRTLSPAGSRVLGKTLAVGLSVALVRQGGWVPLGGQRLPSGPLPPLTFTPGLLELLRWTSALGGGEPPGPLVLSRPFTVAEQAFVALLLERLEGTALEQELAGQLPVRTSPLATLACAPLLLAGEELPPPENLSVELLPAVHGLQSLLARRLAAQCPTRPQYEPLPMARGLEALEATAVALLELLQRAGQLRLATFVLRAAQTALADDRPLQEDLDPRSPLSVRQRIRRARAWLWRLVGWVERAQHALRLVHFIDDGHAEAQAALREWAFFGEVRFRQAAERAALAEALP